MTGYKLSLAAQADLISIALYGDERHGVEQSDHYRDQLSAHFEILAKQPMLYPAVDHIRQGYRRSLCGVHSVYYRITDRGVEIMRIIGRQDFTNEV
ncbi:type II toxin-antitoxin system RelE/ParE family toxin (plasmid) [Roseibium porphyridii]|uniref:Type II toxin-antitoxin system RelE/ParE family toxin n=1 Tax=Roseibium porphyridii TaxID=2866279 RepID=A0ABY8FAY5_9HYPH|nr:type II toxin-antitoxin system RelE/ParE family toxin [Roseibium sp. KMA01]WFE92650.1 type II toxin-antitoxin system RelE/ParE family toxin [Roseibium sp. KMA01]